MDYFYYYLFCIQIHVSWMPAIASMEVSVCITASRWPPAVSAEILTRDTDVASEEVSTVHVQCLVILDTIVTWWPPTCHDPIKQNKIIFKGRTVVPHM